MAMHWLEYIFQSCPQTRLYTKGHSEQLFRMGAIVFQLSANTFCNKENKVNIVEEIIESLLYQISNVYFDDKNEMKENCTWKCTRNNYI